MHQQHYELTFENMKGFSYIILSDYQMISTGSMIMLKTATSLFFCPHYDWVMQTDRQHANVQ